MWQLGTPVESRSYFSLDGVAQTGLTVNVKQIDPAHTITAGVATEIGQGFYTYTVSAAVAGSYTVLFTPTTVTDQGTQLAGVDVIDLTTATGNLLTNVIDWLMKIYNKL